MLFLLVVVSCGYQAARAQQPCGKNSTGNLSYYAPIRIILTNNEFSIVNFNSYQVAHDVSLITVNNKRSLWIICIPLSNNLLLSSFYFLVAMLSTGGVYSFRVMSYNIRYETTKDGINQWSLRKNNVINVIQNRAPDLFGVQEGLPRQITDLKNGLPAYHYFGVGGNDGRNSGEFSAIFYRFDRFDLLDKGTFWLSKTPTIPGSKGWDAAGTRTCNWVKLRDRRTSQTFYHFNTHFDSQGQTSRLESARLILSQTKSIVGSSTPIILTGDFNASPYSDGYHTFTRNTPFKDSFELSEKHHCGPDSTFSTFIVGNTMGKRIDHIFVTSNDLKVLQHGTLTDSNNGYYPSDHLPVLAEITFKNKISG
jgi:endonuclease/exonuclease/phosphatase family metal-dependent hydrolase